MEQRNLGRSGLIVSAVGLGCNNFGGRMDMAATRAVVHKALDLGVTFFDTSDTYGNRGASEEYLGRALGRTGGTISCSLPNSAVRWTVKGGCRAPRAAISCSAVEASLKRLGTDYIDLYYQHIGDPPHADRGDAARARRSRAAGQGALHRLLDWLPAWQVVEAQWTSKHFNLAAFISCQERYNVLERELDEALMPVLQSYGLGLVPFAPLANGLLTGKYRRDAPPPSGTRLAAMPHIAERYLTEANWDTVERLAAFCAARGRTPARPRLLLAAASPDGGERHRRRDVPEQVAANVGAAEWRLSREDMDEIDRITAN